MAWKILNQSNIKVVAVATTDEIMAAIIDGMKNDKIVGVKSAAKYVNKVCGTILSVSEIIDIYNTVLAEAQKFVDADDISKVSSDILSAADFEKVKFKNKEE